MQLDVTDTSLIKDERTVDNPDQSVRILSVVRFDHELIVTFLQ